MTPIFVTLITEFAVGKDYSVQGISIVVIVGFQIEYDQLIPKCGSGIAMRFRAATEAVNI